MPASSSRPRSRTATTSSPAWHSRPGSSAPRRLVDFVDGRVSRDLPDCSYVPGVHSVDLAAVLPPAATAALRTALAHFGRTMRGWLTNDAIAVGVETRTSAPVRIPRDATTCMHPDASGLFPCGEGAGAAGGIVSAAMDGDRCARTLVASVDAGRRSC